MLVGEHLLVAESQPIHSGDQRCPECAKSGALESNMGVLQWNTSIAKKQIWLTCTHYDPKRSGGCGYQVSYQELCRQGHLVRSNSKAVQLLADIEEYIKGLDHASADLLHVSDSLMQFNEDVKQAENDFLARKTEVTRFVDERKE